MVERRVEPNLPEAPRKRVEMIENDGSDHIAGGFFCIRVVKKKKKKRGGFEVRMSEVSSFQT